MKLAGFNNLKIHSIIYYIINMRKSFIGGMKCNGTRQSVLNLVNILNENISFTPDVYVHQQHI